MLKQPRLDVRGAPHHVLGRGAARTEVFPGDADRADSVTRLAGFVREGVAQGRRPDLVGGA